VLRKFKRGKFSLIIGFLLACGVYPQFICAALPGQVNPMEIIQKGTERALQLLHEAQVTQAPALRQRKVEILDIVSEYFSFEEMARRALGRPWKDQPSDKREEFVRLFKQLLFNAYINRLESYTGSNERVYYDSELVEGDHALVRTHIILQGDQNVSIDYRLCRSGEQWKVYDVVVEGISFVDNYRSQFASILTNESFDSLLRKLREKVAQSS
jgi:phospholipid transport system substrate-binding protein